MALAAEFVASQSSGLIAAAIAAVFTIGYIAQMLGVRIPTEVARDSGMISPTIPI